MMTSTELPSFFGNPQSDCAEGQTIAQFALRMWKACLRKGGGDGEW